MTNEKFQREKTYQITLHIVRKIIQDGILTEDEMRMIDTILIKKYNPLLGCLYP
jgi:hypothetical protein